MGCYCTCILFRNKIFFHPAKFDNFKDETILDYKTVSVPQSQILAGLKTLGQVGLWATFEGSLFMFWEAKNLKKKFTPQNIKNSPQKLLIIPLDHQFSVQQVFALWNWDSFKVWNFLIFKVVKLCRMKTFIIGNKMQVQ